MKFVLKITLATSQSAKHSHNIFMDRVKINRSALELTKASTQLIVFLTLVSPPKACLMQTQHGYLEHQIICYPL